MKSNIYAKKQSGKYEKINSLPFACCNVRLQNPPNFSQVRFLLLYRDLWVRPPFVNNTNFLIKSQHQSYFRIKDWEVMCTLACIQISYLKRINKYINRKVCHFTRIIQVLAIFSVLVLSWSCIHSFSEYLINVHVMSA